MDQPVGFERRTDVRVPCTSALGVRLILRPGYPVTVLDVSAGGALIQGHRPLRPGALVHVRLVTPLHAHSLPALVVRCTVWAIDPEVGVVYRGALRFDERCEWFTSRPPEALPHEGIGLRP